MTVETTAVQVGDVVEIGRGTWWVVIGRPVDEVKVERAGQQATYPLGAIRAAMRL